MKDIYLLIEALTLMAKYMDDLPPTNCNHDELWVNCDPGKVSKEDLERLEALHFSPDTDSEGMYSFYFGSC